MVICTFLTVLHYGIIILMGNYSVFNGSLHVLVVLRYEIIILMGNSCVFNGSLYVFNDSVSISNGNDSILLRKQ